MTVTPNLLQQGENIIAVEIHQISTSASDISFNLDLLATPLQQTDTAQAATIGGVLHLLWTGPWTPQQSNGLTEWVDRPDVRSPWRIEGAAQRSFFRLRQ